MNVDDKPEASLCTTEKGKIFIICNLKYERAFSNNRAVAEELGEREISENRRSGEERDERYNTLHFRKVITHELQHAIQVNEGLAEGGNPNIELKKLKANSGAIQSFTEKEQEYIAIKKFLNKAGEIEAMSSDVRIDLDKLQRSLRKPYSEIAIDKKYFSSDLETKIKFNEGGELIKRADGSYSRRGLYDNIRDNVGSGRKPTKQMLEQEAKIKDKYSLGGKINEYSVNEFEFYLEDKYNANIDLGDYKKYIYLSKISIPKEIRGLGIGTEIMNEIIAYADENNRLLTLTPSTDYGATSISRLKEFYKNFGFIENKGRNKDFEISQSMYRVPVNEKYHLGGDMSKHLAPNGKPSKLTHEQWHLVREPAFISWFGDWINSPETASKAVDSNGEPLVVYHGSNKKIDSFRADENQYVYFTNDINLADTYAIHRSKKSNSEKFIYDTYLKIINPLIIDANFESWDNISTKSIENSDVAIKDLLKRGVDTITTNIAPKIAIKNGFDGVIISNIYDGVGFGKDAELSNVYVALHSNQIKLADGTNTTFDSNNDDIRYKQGGNISNMTPSELKAFYNTPEGKKLDAETYAEWKGLVNMSKSELENFYNSIEGKKAGLTTSQAKEQGINSGRESARWIMKMKDIPYKEWSSDMWRWAKKQINFIKRMSGMRGGLYNDKGEKTRKHTALLIWGHNPEKFKFGGEIQGVQSFSKWFIDWYKPISDEMNISFSLPNEIQPYKEKNVVILDVFEKKDQSIDAKKYLQKIVDKADEFKVTIYLEPSPKHTYFLDNEEKKSKITKEYLINYYSKFGFVVNSDYYSMKRTPNSEKKFKGGGVISQKALAVETTDLKDYVRKYFVKDGRIDVSDAMQELFGNKRGKSTHAEYQKRIGLHKKGGLTISELAHKLWEEHKDEVRSGVDDSDFREAVEDVISSEYGVSSMIKSLMEKSEEGIEDEEAKYWANQFDENEYSSDDEQLTDEEMSMIFRDMEQAERELAKGTEHEMEHLDTLKKVSEGKITPEEAVVQTASTHIAENKNYYEDLAKMEKEHEGIKIGTEFYDYYEPIKQKVVSFDSERVFSVPVNIPISEQDDYRLKRIFKIDKFKEILSRQDEFEAEINSSLESKGKLDLKKETETKKELIKKEEKDRISKAFSGSKLQVGKKLATLRKIIKVNGVLFDLKEYIEKLANELSGNEKIEIKNIKNEPHLSINGSSYKPLINETGLEYFKYLLSLKESESEESIPDLIEGLKVLLEYTEGTEKTELENTIEGLEILLESDDKFAEGGSVLWATKIGEPDYNEQLITENSSQIENAKKWAIENGFDRIRVSKIDMSSKPDFTQGFKKYKEGGELDNNSMFFETSKADQDEEKRIMEDQFGKNI
jgi:predicted GNAT family N-acyltransferase